MSIWDIRPEQKEMTRATSSGIDLQLIEEMAELTQALLKRRRYNGEGQPTDKSRLDIEQDIINELTDVLICAKEYVWWNDIEDSTLTSVEDYKLERTIERLKVEGMLDE